MLTVMRCVMACVLVGMLAPAIGCKDEQSDAPPPPSTGGAAVGSVGSGGRPSPPDDEDEDGGAAGVGGAAGIDGGADSGMLAEECQNVPPVQIPADELPPGVEASTSAPADFRVTRLVGSWRGGCAEPVFMVEMSEGDCPDGRDHALTFAIDAASLVDGSLRLGLNTLGPEPNDVGISIRYVRPPSRPPEGEWGSCADATGMFDLTGEEPSTESGSTLQMRFSLDLTACDGSESALQTVSGTFQVMVRRDFRDVCPEP
jgi:hypothetical protein